jgi:O-antigen/teichoic acid export membrane protein
MGQRRVRFGRRRLQRPWALRRGSQLAKTLANFLHLIAGNGLAMAINALVLIVMARALGPGPLGFFAMIESYGTVVDQLIRLESWQPLIRYGSRALEENNRARFRALVKLGIAIDLAGATLAALVAFWAIPIVAGLLGWPDAIRELARWYCLTILAGVSSTPVAILRLFDRFRQLAWLEPLIAVLRLGVIWLVFEFHRDLGAAIAVFIATQVLYRTILGVLAWRELRRYGLGSVLSAEWRDLRGTLREYGRLLVATNVAALIRKSTQELDVLILGAVAGAAATGVYELVRRVTLAAIKAGTMLQQVAFPDLSRLWARRDFALFQRIVIQIELLSAAFGGLFVLFVALRGEWLITFLAGNRFGSAGTPLLFQSIAGCLFLSGSALRAALITMGREVTLLVIVACSAVVFYVVLWFAAPVAGATGTAAAHIAFNLLLLPLVWLTYASAIRPVRASPAAALPPHHSDPGLPPRSQPGSGWRRRAS